jgi:hypothetical protein
VGTRSTVPGGLSDGHEKEAPAGAGARRTFLRLHQRAAASPIPCLGFAATARGRLVNPPWLGLRAGVGAGSARDALDEVPSDAVEPPGQPHERLGEAQQREPGGDRIDRGGGHTASFRKTACKAALTAISRARRSIRPWSASDPQGSRVNLGTAPSGGSKSVPVPGA